MKTHPTASLLGVLLSLAAISTVTARPGPPGGPPPPMVFSNGENSETAQPKPQPAVTEEELGTARDKFDTYRKLTFEGFRYYVKSEETQRLLHSEIYQKIRANALSERLTVTQARGFVANLLVIARNNAAIRQDGGSANDETKKAVQNNLEELSKTIDLALLDKVKGEVLTPDLDRREWLMDELVHFGADTSLSQTRVASLVKHLEGLLTDEERAKQSGDLSDTERNKLLESSVETWKVFLRTFAR
ncbi:MAG: hypothetical protein ABIT37_00475 [Luteolibacter sp.]